ncbi:MAG: hypothetical protein ACP5UT_11230 [Bryobacteraceae bacterium]
MALPPGGWGGEPVGLRAPWSAVAQAEEGPLLVAGTSGAALAHPLGRATTVLAVHPERLAWLSRSGGGLVRLEDASGQLQPLPAQSEDSSWRLIRWSPAGSSLILCDATSCHVFRLDDGGLHSQWILPAAADDVAVSDDGQAVLWTEQGRLWMAGPGAAPRTLSDSPPITFAFLRHSHRYAVAAEDRLWIAGHLPLRLKDLPPEPADPELSESLKIRQLVPAGRFGWLATGLDSSGACRLWLLNAHGGIEDAADCPSPGVRLSPAGNEGLLQLTGAARRPLWFARVSTRAIHVFFVPGIPAEGE